MLRLHALKPMALVGRKSDREDIAPIGTGPCCNPTSIPSPGLSASIGASTFSRCKKPRCLERATLIAEKVDGAARHVRQIELCTRASTRMVDGAGWVPLASFSDS